MSAAPRRPGPANPTSAEAAAELVGNMRPLDPIEARAVAPLVAAAAKRIESGGKEAAPTVVTNPEAIPGRIHARPLRRDAPLGRGALVRRPRALVTRPGHSPTAADPRTVGGVERAR